MIEQRTVPRWRVQRQTVARIEEDVLRNKCCLEDLSFKGMCLSFSEALPTKSLFRIVLSLMDGLEIDVLVEVRWVSQRNGRHVYGMSFNRIKDADKDGIYQYLHKNFTEQWRQHWGEGTSKVSADRHVEHEA